MINREEIVTVFSDVTGKEISEPEHVSIKFKGTTYVVDIDGSNAEEELATLSLAEAIRVGRVEQPRRSTRRSARAQLHSKVRKWAREQNIEVGARGDVPEEIIQRYLKASAKSEEPLEEHAEQAS